MKKFEEPKLNVEELEVEDVITASTGEGDPDCNYQTECLGD